MPAPMQLGAWWAEKFNRLFQNQRGVPSVKRVEAVLEMSAGKRIAAVESAWLDQNEVSSGGKLTGKIALRPWRGERLVRDFSITLPAGLARGEHRLAIGDASLLNRAATLAGMVNRDLDLAQTVHLINQEKPNDRIYVALVEARPTVYEDDQALKGVPASLLNVIQTGAAGRPLAGAPETSRVLQEIVLGQIVSGSTALRFRVR